MDTILKVLFGVMFGVVGCLAYDHVQTLEARKRGLAPGWVSIAGNTAGTEPFAAPVTPPPAPTARTAPTAQPQQPAPAVAKPQKTQPPAKPDPLENTVFGRRIK